jgi:hypothetical protein
MSLERLEQEPVSPGFDPLALFRDSGSKPGLMGSEDDQDSGSGPGLAGSDLTGLTGLLERGCGGDVYLVAD